MSADNDREYDIDHELLVSGEVAKIPTMGELAEKIDAVARVVQSQGETQLEIYTAVKALGVDVGKLRGVVLARVPPGYRWASLACLVAIAYSLLRIAYSSPEQERPPITAVHTTAGLFVP